MHVRRDTGLLSGALVVRDVSVDAVRREEVLRYLGHRGQVLSDQLDARLDDEIGHALALARPRVALRCFAVADRAMGDGGVPVLSLAGSVLALAGESIATHLAAADEVVVLAVTAGMGIERELQRLSLAGDGLDQLLFDAAATAVVERAADTAEAWIVADAAAADKGTATRFSPGYGDLPLACQAPLLASVDATRRLGVTLTASSLLVPTKSVTAVIGVGAEVRRASAGGCASCDLRDRCSVRAAGGSCHVDSSAG